MIIKKSTIEAFERKQIEDSNRSFVSDIRRLFPEEVEFVENNDLLNYIHNLRELCNTLNIKTEKGIFGFICIGFLLGNEFYSDNEFLKLFHDKNSSGDQVVENFYSSINIDR